MLSFLSGFSGATGFVGSFLSVGFVLSFLSSLGTGVTAFGSSGVVVFSGVLFSSFALVVVVVSLSLSTTVSSFLPVSLLYNQAPPAANKPTAAAPIASLPPLPLKNLPILLNNPPDFFVVSFVDLIISLPFSLTTSLTTSLFWIISFSFIPLTLAGSNLRACFISLWICFLKLCLFFLGVLLLLLMLEHGFSFLVRLKLLNLFVVLKFLLH